MGFAAPPHHTDVTLLASPWLCLVARSSVSEYCEHQRNEIWARNSISAEQPVKKQRKQDGETLRQAIYGELHDLAIANALVLSILIRPDLLRYEHNRLGSCFARPPHTAACTRPWS
ncbi:hypothetical protein V8C26DRAFT_383706 [Trichoderma gracile]